MEFRRKALAAVTVIGVVAGLSGAASADNLDILGDNVETAVTTVAFGEVCAGTTQSRDVDLRISRNGNYGSTNVFKKSSSASVYWQSTSVPPQANLSATPTAAQPGSIAIPADWDTAANNTMTAPTNGSLSVTFASGYAGDLSGSAGWRAAGVRSDNTALTREDSVSWTATVKNCSAPADSAAPTSPSITINGGDAWTNSRSVSLAISGADVVGVSKYRLAETQAGLANSADVAVNPAVTSFSATPAFTLSDSDGSKAVWLRLYDAAGNSADASDTIGLDRVAPTITGDTGSYVPGTWTNQSVVVNFTCADNDGGSGIATDTVAGSTLSSNGADQSLSNTGACVDQAGNSATGSSVSDIDIDKVKPTIAGDTDPYVPGTWTNQSVVVSFTCTDNTGGSGIATNTVAGDTLEGSGANQSVTNTGTCTDNAGNEADSDTVSDIDIDKVKPTITGSTGTYTPGTWTNQPVVVSFTCADDTNGSGVDTDTVAGITVDVNGPDHSVSNSGSCTDSAGNVADQATVSNIDIDQAPPTITLNGGPADGGSYYFGSVPAAPTCMGEDQEGLSGTTGTCTVTGYSSAVGNHTVTGAQSDAAGNQGSVSASYQVKAWTLKGFYSPVDGNGVLNTVKGGSTVPLKFEAFAGLTELTNTNVVDTFKVATVNCGTLATTGTDDIEQYSTGGTSLRYDGGQFIQNWQTPKTANLCFKVTLTLDDGTSATANFKTK